MNQKLIDLATWLRANPVPKLDMTCWKGSHPCGTTHCIMGWVAENLMFGFYLIGLGFIRHIDSEPDEKSWAAILRGLEISKRVADMLFSPSQTSGISFEAIVDRIELMGKSYESKVD